MQQKQIGRYEIKELLGAGGMGSGKPCVRGRVAFTRS